MKRKTRALAAAALCGMLTLGGCSRIIFPFLAQLFPKKKVAAQFTLPKKKRILVFPDDLKQPVSYPPIKRALVEKLNALLLEKKLAAEVIDYGKLDDLRGSDPDFNLRHVPTIGKRLGADLVIYANIQEFRLKDTPVDTLWRGRFAVRVKVVDSQTGRIWPDESAGHPVAVSEPDTVNASESYGIQLSKALAERLAVEIAGLFHTRWVDRTQLPPPSEEFQTP